MDDVYQLPIVGVILLSSIFRITEIGSGSPWYESFKKIGYCHGFTIIFKDEKTVRYEQNGRDENDGEKQSKYEKTRLDYAGLIAAWTRYTRLNVVDLK